MRYGRLGQVLFARASHEHAASGTSASSGVLLLLQLLSCLLDINIFNTRLRLSHTQSSMIGYPNRPRPGDYAPAGANCASLLMSCNITSHTSSSDCSHVQPTRGILRHSQALLQGAAGRFLCYGEVQVNCVCLHYSNG